MEKITQIAVITSLVGLVIFYILVRTSPSYDVKTSYDIEPSMPEKGPSSIISTFFIALVFIALSSSLGIAELWALKNIGFDVVANLSAELLGVKITAVGAIAYLAFQPILLLYMTKSILKF